MCKLLPSQNVNIEIPNGGRKIESTKRVLAFLKVYLSKEGIISVQNKNISLSELGNLAYTFKNKNYPPWKIKPLVVLYIDIRTPFKYFNRIETELKSANVDYIYGTKSYDQIPKGIFFMVRNPVFTYRQKTSDNQISFSYYDIPKENKAFPSKAFVDCLYTYKFKEAKKILKKIDYKAILFLKDGFIRIENFKYSHLNDLKLYEDIKDAKILIIKYSPRLSYKDYLENILILKGIINKYIKNKDKMPYLLIVSEELNSELKKNNVSF